MDGCETLSAIRAHVEQGPTVLGVAGEVEVLRQLQAVPYDVVARCHHDFDEITSALYMSHMDTYFEVNDSNIAPFSQFATWLDGLGEFVGGDARQSLHGLAAHFRVNSKNFKL